MIFRRCGSLKIGDLKIKGHAALAPMAGVADRAMREICVEFGAAYTVGELTSAKGVSMGDKKSESYLLIGEKERPMASQLFGGEPDVLAVAAKTAEKFSPDFIDVNMGCPAPKVAGNGGGSALLRDPERAAEIVKSVKAAVGLPVTAKIRIGWDANSINAVSFAKRLEDAGVDAITVHGRTRAQMYSPPVDYDVIKAVKEAVKVPVVANGDIVDGPSAKAVLEKTKADFLMVGRAAMGNPFVFREINHFFETGEILPPPSLEEKLKVMRRQIELMIKYKGEHIGLLEARKHTAWYVKGLKGAANIRKMCGEIKSLHDIDLICEKIMEENKNET